MAADTSIDPAAYPSEALKLADTLTPDLAASLKTCNVEAARSVHKRASEFIYKKWNWGANYEQLKPYRACFQMLSDIAAATQLVTNKSLNTPPRMVAGLYDANYASCRRLADPSFQSTEVSGNMKWPDRFGAEPSKRPCG
jgi:hypothetical protein